jgi:hypothetical protein
VTATPLLLPYRLADLIPFPRVREAAAYALALSARWSRVSKTKPWRRPRQPERLGNLLQQLADKRPAVVFVIESLVAEMVKQLDQ